MSLPDEFAKFLQPLILDFDNATEQVRQRQLQLGNCLNSLNDELAALYKQCPGDSEVEDYIKRIHLLRQRINEANIQVRIIEDRMSRMDQIVAKSRT